MIKKQKIEFQKTEDDSSLNSKFGGQPNWINTPQWPIGPNEEEPMIFLGQITLDDAIFPNCGNVTAYIFFEGDFEPLYDENITIVLQTPETTYVDEENEYLTFIDEAEGPMLSEVLVKGEDEVAYNIYKVIYSEVEHEAVVTPQENYQSIEFDSEKGYHFLKPELAGNKVGGQPLYISGMSTPPEVFTSENWLQLLQLAPTKGYWTEDFNQNFLPFYIEMGDSALLNIFISKDYTKAKCIIQQP